MSYPVIDGKATGENILRRRRELGYSVLDVQKYLNLACPQGAAPSVLLGMTVNGLVVERESR